MTTTATTIITAIVITTITITKYEIYYTQSRAARPYGGGVEYNRNGVRTTTDYVSNYTADCWRIAWPPLLAAAHANAIPFVSAADEGSAPVFFFFFGFSRSVHAYHGDKTSFARSPSNTHCCVLGPKSYNDRMNIDWKRKKKKNDNTKTEKCK